MPLNLLLIPKIGKFGIIVDTRPCEIDDLAVSSRQSSRYTSGGVEWLVVELPKLRLTLSAGPNIHVRILEPISGLPY